jgi:hypothetical protein
MPYHRRPISIIRRGYNPQYPKVPLSCWQRRHLPIPVEQHPVAKQRLQDTGEQGRRAFADIEQEPREGERLAFAQYPRKQAIDVFAAIDLLIEPLFERLNVFPSLKGGDFFNKRTTLRPGKSQ